MASQEWIKIYGDRKKKEKKYTHVIQLRFDDATWEGIEGHSKAAGCNKAEFVRVATKLFIDQLEQTGVIDTIKEGIKNG